jgi:uncharacterized RDD family membrane protein YckC
MDYQEYVKYEPFLARRAWAATLDYLLYGGIVFGYVNFFGTENEQGMIEAKGIQHVLAVMFLWLLYFPTMEGMFGFTLFKGLFDLKIAPERRKDFRFAVAFKRHLLDPIDFFLFGVVAIILVKTREDHKRLGDMLAHSRVVLDKEEEPSGGLTPLERKKSRG